MYAIKIEEDENLIRYVKLIRAYDKSVSLNEIKHSIQSNTYVVSHSMNKTYDVSDDVNNVDKTNLFRMLIDDLLNAGANINIYLKDREIDINMLDNLIDTAKQIEIEITQDLENEVNAMKEIKE